MSTIRSLLSSWPVVLVLLAGSASVLYVALRRGTRLTPQPWYTGEMVLGSVLVPLFVLLIAAVPIVAVEMVLSWGVSPLGETQLAAVAILGLAFAAATVLILRVTPPSAEETPGARILHMPQGQPPEPPPPQRLDRVA